MNYLGIVGTWQWIIILIAALSIMLTIIALIDILKSKFEGNNKIVWVLVVLFFNLIGSILYFAIGRNQRIKS
jgi:heme/copper-type cytochrome/quinol oxidase subunit 4